MVDAVRHFGGTISQVRDDGVTALFGAPVAHEDHAVRACYAALAMTEAIPPLAHQPLDVRIGIHSGEAVVRTIGDERSRHYDAVGPVPRLAGRIDTVLAPGEIGLTADTARRAEGFVELARARGEAARGCPGAGRAVRAAGESATALALGRALGARAHAVRRSRGRDRPPAASCSSAPRAARGRWWRSWASREWESRGSCTSSSTPRSRRAVPGARDRHESRTRRASPIFRSRT